MAMKKILIVDDEPELLELLKGRLKGRYEIITAPDAEKGFERAVGEAPDLILSDLMMPNVDGFQLLDRLKQHFSTRHIPFVIISAFGESRQIMKAQEMGATDFLIKPLHLEELPDIVRRYA